MIENMALKLAIKIKNLEPNQTASVEVMKFSIEALLNNLITLVLVLVLAICTDSVFLALMGLIAFSVLRFFSGGYHFKNSITCSIVSTIIIFVSTQIELSHNYFVLLSVISLIIVLIYAPANIANHARIDSKYFPLLKIVATIIVLSSVIIVSSTVTLAVFFQSLTLLIPNKEVGI
ncbi:accessory gene regulator B family protein [Cohnella endophytica]|nr:accessory gene regulator B family protein [Cohnella endophytica]